MLEETNLKGNIKQLLGTCSHFNTIFGDILLIGIEMEILNWAEINPGDDASEAKIFPQEQIPKLAFPCYEKILKMYCMAH